MLSNGASKMDGENKPLKEEKKNVFHKTVDFPIVL